jgi:hypothetical protein
MSGRDFYGNRIKYNRECAAKLVVGAGEQL